MKNLLILLLFTCSLSVNGQIQQQSSFETALPSGWQGPAGGAQPNKKYQPFDLIEGSETWSLAISTAFARSGTSSLKTDLRPGDRATYYSSYRTEITMIPKGSAVTTAANCFGGSVYIPSSAAPWVNAQQDKIIGMQSHPWLGNTTNGSPNWSIHIKAGRWQMWIVHTGANTANNAAQTFLPPIDMGPVVYDVWTDWEVFCNNLKTTAGRIIANKVVNGVRTDKVCDYTGYALHGFSSWPFIKMGTYDWNINKAPVISTPRVVYYDMFRYGRATEATFSSVIGLPGAPPAPPNQAPVITAFTSNDNYSAGVTSAALNVSATDPESGPLTYQWAKVSGAGTQVISNGTTNAASVSPLANSNSYVFRITVTDNKGATATATKSITIATANNAPVANAGISRQLSLGADSVHMDGEGTDTEDGGTCCTPHVWSVVSKPTGSNPVFTPTDWNPVVTNLIEGTYVFKLTITDSGGLTSESTVSYTVPHVNQSPTVTPAPPLIRLRTATTGTIGCVPSDPDGPKPTVQWSQLSGPNTATITSPTSDTTTLTGLIIGVYKFKVVVTDNKGATAQTEVEVQVNNPPTVDLSGNTTVTLPTGTTSYSAVSSPADTDGTISSGIWTIIDKPVGATDPTFSDASTNNTTINNLTSDGVYIFRREVLDNDGVPGYADLILTITTTKTVVPKIRYRVL